MYLALNNVVKVFPAHGGSGEVVAVDGISIEIAQGELVTLLGPSGCGKTTTLRLIAGFEFPTDGQIVLDGRQINDLPPHRRDMSMVFQSYAIFPHLNVFENVAYGLNVQHRSRAEIGERVARVLALVELTGLESRAPNQLSGGQQQRVALARALIMEPKVLLMDEPLSNLDAKLREQMRTEIRRIQKQLGITTVYVTHDQVEAMTLSDRVVVIHRGAVEQVGTPQDVYRHPRTRFVADFIGRANFVPGVVRKREAGASLIEVCGQPFRVPGATGGVAEGGEVTLVVRPEMIRVLPDRGKLSGVVWRATYLGNAVEYDVQVNGQLLTAVETDPARVTVHPEGSRVGLDFFEDGIHIIA